MWISRAVGMCWSCHQCHGKIAAPTNVTLWKAMASWKSKEKWSSKCIVRSNLIWMAYILTYGRKQFCTNESLLIILRFPSKPEDFLSLILNIFFLYYSKKLWCWFKLDISCIYHKVNLSASARKKAFNFNSVYFVLQYMVSSLVFWVFWGDVKLLLLLNLQSCPTAQWT